MAIIERSLLIFFRDGCLLGVFVRFVLVVFLGLGLACK